MARIKRATYKGDPGVRQPVRNWPPFRRPLLRIRSIRTLIKRDEAKGVTMPEFHNLTDAHGVATPGSGGYKGARQIRQQPNTPPTSDSVTRIKPPSPKGKGSIGKRVR